MYHVTSESLVLAWRIAIVRWRDLDLWLDLSLMYKMTSRDRQDCQAGLQHPSSTQDANYPISPICYLFPHTSRGLRRTIPTRYSYVNSLIQCVISLLLLISCNSTALSGSRFRVKDERGRTGIIDPDKYNGGKLLPLGPVSASPLLWVPEMDSDLQNQFPEGMFSK